MNKKPIKWNRGRVGGRAGQSSQNYINLLPPSFCIGFTFGRRALSASPHFGRPSRPSVVCFTAYAVYKARRRQWRRRRLPSHIAFMLLTSERGGRGLQQRGRLFYKDAKRVFASLARCSLARSLLARSLAWCQDTTAHLKATLSVRDGREERV